MRSFSTFITLLLLAATSAKHSHPVQSHVALQGSFDLPHRSRDLKMKQKDVGVMGDHRDNVKGSESSTSSSKKKWVAPVAASLTTVVVLGGIMIYAFRRKKRMTEEAEKGSNDDNLVVESNIEVPDEDKSDKMNQVDHEDEEVEVVGEI